MPGDHTPDHTPLSQPRNFPIPRPRGGIDERFSNGLVLDLVNLLERHGYPTATASDQVELHLALFDVLYQPTHTTPANTATVAPSFSGGDAS